MTFNDLSAVFQIPSYPTIVVESPEHRLYSLVSFFFFFSTAWEVREATPVSQRYFYQKGHLPTILPFG